MATEISRKALLISAFFIALLLGATSNVFAESCLPKGNFEWVRVAQVVDGDTLRLTDGRKVRLIGVNTPELYRKPKAELGALQAQRAVKRWISKDLVQLYTGVEKKDKYGRVLGYVRAGDQLLSKRLISQGLGWAVSVPPNIQLSSCFFDAETKARLNRLGVWKSKVTSAKQLKQGGFAVVTGQITRIDRAAKASYVEVDDHLALRLPLGWVEQFSLDIGTQLEVRGWIISRQRSRFKPFFLPIIDKHHLNRLD